MIIRKLSIVLSAAALLVSCGIATPSITRQSQYPGMYSAKPVTLLVMPPINNSAHADAKDLLYTSIAQPLAEAGYYVISPFLSMDILRQESAYDAELFLDANLGPFRQFFGADAVVFSIIDTWAKQGFGIATKIRYLIKDTSNGETLFDRTCDLYLDLSVDSEQSGVLASLVELAASAVATATTEHITAARKCNQFIFKDIPRGKYSPSYLKDQDFEASAKNITAKVK